MRQSKISDQGYLEEPFTRFTAAILISWFLLAIYVCIDMNMNNLLAQIPIISNNSWELEDLAVYTSFRWLIRPMVFCDS
jgi:hypothetical protein